MRSGRSLRPAAAISGMRNMSSMRAVAGRRSIETAQGHSGSDIPKRIWLLRRGTDEPHGRRGRRSKGPQSTLEEIAVAITALIRRGFPPDYAMTLTPRQIAAYLEFSDKLDRIERADALMIAAIGAQGDSKAIEKTIKELSD